MVSKALGNNHDPDQDEAHVSPLTKQDDWNEYYGDQTSPDDITQFFSAFLNEYRQRKENLGNQLSQFLQLLSQEVEVPNTQDNVSQEVEVPNTQDKATRDSVLVAVAKAFVEESTRLQEVDINWDRNAVGAAPRCTISHPDSQKYDIGRDCDFDGLVQDVQSKVLILVPYDFTHDAKSRCTTDLVRIA